MLVDRTIYTVCSHDSFARLGNSSQLIRAQKKQGFSKCFKENHLFGSLGSPQPIELTLYDPPNLCPRGL